MRWRMTKFFHQCTLTLHCSLLLPAFFSLRLSASHDRRLDYLPIKPALMAAEKEKAAPESS